MHDLKLSQEHNEFFRDFVCYYFDDVFPTDREKRQIIIDRCHKFTFENRLLKHLWTEKHGNNIIHWKQTVLLAELRETILFTLHGHHLASHLGFAKTLQRIREHYYWLYMMNDVRKFVKSCITCAQTAVNPGPHAPLKLIPCPSEMLSCICIDWVGPISHTPCGNKYIVVFVDALSHWVKAQAISSITAESIARVFYKEVICHHSCPFEIVTDRAPSFMSELFAQVNKLLSV